MLGVPASGFPNRHLFFVLNGIGAKGVCVRMWNLVDESHRLHIQSNPTAPSQTSQSNATTPRPERKRYIMMLVIMGNAMSTSEWTGKEASQWTEEGSISGQKRGQITLVLVNRDNAMSGQRKGQSNQGASQWTEKRANQFDVG